MKRICVFCGANPGSSPAFAAAAHALGAALARRGLELVYGGGNVGLMGAVADGALKGGGRVIGVIPRALVDKELAHGGVQELIVVASMHERKARMVELSDAFIALPGGFGTCDELCEVLTWSQLGFHAKPIALLDVDGYWSSLTEFFERAVASGFLRRENRALLLLETDAERVLDLLARERPPRVEKWIGRGET